MHLFYWSYFKLVQSKIAMLFSFKEFEQTKNLIIKQFQQQPTLELPNDDHETIYEYQKLLNRIKHLKGKESRGKMPDRAMKRRQAMVKSATHRRFQKFNDYKIMEAGSSDRFDKFGKQNQMIRISSESGQDNFYLTSLTINEKQFSQKNIDYGTKSDPNEQQRLTLNQSFNEKQKELLDLHVNIIELTNQQKYLSTEISQLEQSIRYFRSLNNGIEQKINQQDKKNTIELHSALKKQSDLNAVTSRNKYFEEKFNSTEVFFVKSLKSIKVNRNSQTKKCSEMLDDATQKILTLKYLKQKIEHQRVQMSKLDQKKRYKCKRIEETKNVHQYCLIMLKIHKLTNFIKGNPYGKIQEIKELIEDKDKEIEGLKNNSRVLSKSKVSKVKILNEPVDTSQIDYLAMTKQILKTYLKLRNDEERLKQTYEYKINEMENNRKLLGFNLKTKQSDSRLGSTAGSKSSQILIKLGEKVDDLIEIDMTKQERKIKKLNEGILAMEERAKFFVKKFIKYLQSIIQKWLKFDQSAINFVIEMANKFLEIDSNPKEQISQTLSKDILVSHFENWDHYQFFIEEVYGNPLMNNSLTKNLFVEMLRRIIKTKINHPKVKTEKMFIKCLRNFHNERLSKMFNNIQMLLKIGVEIVHYSSKFQVFIVNSSASQEGIYRSSEAKEEQKESIQRSSNTEAQKLKTGYRQANEITKVSQKTQEEPEDSQKEDDSGSEIVDEDQIQEEIQKQQTIEESQTIVNLIMAYQLQINKISKIKKNGPH